MPLTAGPPPNEQGPRSRLVRLVTWPRVVMLVLLLGAGGAFAWVWSVTAADRGEILVLRDDPIPGESERIARHRLIYFDDMAEFQAAVDEDTAMLIVPDDRVDALGEDWLDEQLHGDVATVVRLTAPEREDRRAFGAQTIHTANHTCGATRINTNTMMYDEWRAGLTRWLDHWYMVCG